MLRDFKAFLLKQNVLSLALAVVVGGALTGLVTSVVEGFIMPIVAAATPGGAWREWTLAIGTVLLKPGAFLAALLNFIVVSLVAWRIAKMFMKPETPAAKAATKTCPHCRMEIDAQASRCSHCTSQLGATAAA
jgi:large conductance mechanosensitive channel